MIVDDDRGVPSDLALSPPPAPAKHTDVQPMSMILLTRPDTGFAFAYTVSDQDGVQDCSLLVPDLPAIRDHLEAFIADQPGLRDISDEARSFAAFAPESVSWKLVASDYWTSKPAGATGVNLSLGPALFALPNGTPALALSASRNIALQDPLNSQDLADLTGAGSRLAKFVLIFSEIVTKACPDIDKIIWAAEAYGYARDDLGDDTPGDTSFTMAGGHGPSPRSEDRTSTIHVNDQTDYDFEFAVSFILDDRLDATTIRHALFSHLGVLDHVRADGSAPLTLQGDDFILSHLVESATFGNHAFLLQK